jgi:hypothetical protein
MFNSNDKIIIRDPNNFYFGKKAKVVCSTDWPQVWNVRVENVYIAINEKYMEAA